MPAARLTMRKTREILRLRLDLKRTHREIGEACKLSPSTVGACLARFRASGLAWPLPEDLDDAEIEARLYPAEQDPGSAQEPDRPEPDWNYVQQELRKKHVTLGLLWEEYKRSQPDGFQYSWFCRAYRAWAATLDLVMRQHHAWGEKCFLDYAGTTVPVMERLTGTIREAQIFIGVLGASNYTYVEATWTQTLPDWIGSHVRLLDFLGGCPAVFVPDNLKSGVTRADNYDPDINPTYRELANHYEVAVIPARKRRPKDKAKVEVGVQIAERWILARLRNRTFYTLKELNEAIREIRDELNDRPFQKLPGSRRKVFEAEEKPCLRELPSQPYRLATWCQARVGPDYHVQVEDHYYSVPFTLVGQVIEARVSGMVVEIVHKGLRVFSHRRSFARFASTTIPEHMPSHHRQKAEWTPERIEAWARKTGPAVEDMARRIMSGYPHPEQGFRACFGLLTLSRRYGAQRLEAACGRAVAVHAFRYKSVKAILEKRLDGAPLPEARPARTAGHHENVRGPDYYREVAPATSATYISEEMG